MTESEDPIAEARRLLADKALYADNVRHLWREDVAKRAPRLLTALCDRLEAAERRPQIRCPLCTDKHDPETDCAE